MAAASYVYRRHGRVADCTRKHGEAFEHDPRNTRIAASYMILRRYEDAENAYRRALALALALARDNATGQTLLSNAIL